MALRLFVSTASSAEDRHLCGRLIKHLRPLMRRGLLTVWDEAEVEPGTDHIQARTAALQEAQVFLPLLSPDYLASDSCYKEVQDALARQGRVPIVPVLLRPCNWQDVLGTEARPLPLSQEGPKAVSIWPDRDTALEAVAQQLRARVVPASRWRWVAGGAALSALGLLAWLGSRLSPAPTNAGPMDMAQPADLLPWPVRDLAPPQPDLRALQKPVKVAPPRKKTTGLAFCHGSLCDLDVDLNEFGAVRKVCLSSADGATFAGRLPICILLREAGTARCTRDDAVRPVPLQEPVTWRLCPR